MRCGRGSFYIVCYSTALLILYALYYNKNNHDTSMWSERNEVTAALVEYHGFCVIHDVVSPLFSHYDRITQILHVSANMLDSKIIDQIRNWSAPVSLTIVLQRVEDYFCTLQFLQSMATEHRVVADNLRVHFIFKLTEDNCTMPIRQHPVGSEICSFETSTTQQIAAYPANVARNVARIFSTSRYVVIADYEHLFNAGFERRMRQIASEELSKNPRNLLVYRIFEIDQSVKDPENKIDLHKLFNKAQAVVFHDRYYKGAHEIANLTEWFRHPEDVDGVQLRDLSYKRWMWEPQFVSLRDIPLHDEAFPFQVRDNTELRWELCRANYSMSVVENLFMFHRGIKTRDIQTSVRKIQKINKPRFQEALKAFNIRMDLFYPNTVNSCPKFKE